MHFQALGDKCTANPNAGAGLHILEWFFMLRTLTEVIAVLVLVCALGETAGQNLQQAAK